VRAALEKQPLQVMDPMMSEELQARVVADTEKDAGIIKDANIKLGDQINLPRERSSSWQYRFKATYEQTCNNLLRPHASGRAYCSRPLRSFSCSRLHYRS